MIRGVPERLGRDLDTIPGVATLPPERTDFCAECDKGECQKCDGFAYDKSVGQCRCHHWDVTG